MIRLPDVSLPDDTHAQLRSLQKRVNRKAAYPDRVDEAKRLFPARNRPRDRTFQVVRSTLAEMCSGVRRCCYCEDSCADEVEHFRPHNLYPELVFVWQNYLYACGPCNGPKRNHFPLFVRPAGSVLDAMRKPNDPVAPPRDGDPVLIDPRSEDALDYMMLDLDATFRFVPIADEDTPAHERAVRTILILRLNERDVLPEARRSAFASYLARLRDYRQQKGDGAASQKLNRLAKGVRGMPHPTVWAEMKRQRDWHTELGALFRNVPEALDW